MDSPRYYDKVGKLGTNPREQIRFARTLPYLLKEGSLLDIGCGEGYWLNFLSRTTKLSLSGADISAIRLQSAREKLSSKEISLTVADIQNLPFTFHSIDQTTALEVLEHIPDWKTSLSELVRVSSKKTIVTVPYNERLKHETCKKCGHEAYLFGHLHSFSEKDFEQIEIEGKMRFTKIPPAFGLTHYLERALKGISSRAKSMMTHENGHTHTTVCQNCYEEVPYTKYLERASLRLLRLLTHSPEYLLVEINK